MNATPPGRAARTARPPLRAVAVLAALACVLLALGFGLTDAPRAVRAAQSPAHDAPAAPGAPAPDGPGPSVPDPSAAPGAGSSDARPQTDGGCTVRTVPLRPQRDAGERTVPAGHLLFTPAHTPRIPPRPARPAPAAGHAPPAAAHTPADLGRAPPGPSST
ncbi:hypothetical protein [Streptomyces sp. KMM 9044]|uniref:hypothetical protein n=1 Tax=Streptomyces sp. KMM 9044 TaxID=2744474 RepID=UPI00215135CC|nr:hypothetical protein [Streptomyces sp. KMM 9044]WAX76692.1 hypothetical protein HUV60_002375 [Streptomyces sp. KMM 9044]